MDIVLIVKCSRPFDGNTSEAILYVEYLPVDTSGQLFAVAQRHFSEQQISAFRITTDMAQQQRAIPLPTIRLFDLKTRDVGGLKEITGNDIAHPLVFYGDGQQPW